MEFIETNLTNALRGYGEPSSQPAYQSNEPTVRMTLAELQAMAQQTVPTAGPEKEKSC